MREELSGVKHSYMLVKQERDAMCKKLIAVKSEMDNFNKLVNERVAKVIKSKQQDLFSKLEEQKQTIEKQ